MQGLPPERGMPQRLRIFVSSPGDVPDERLRADLIVDKLSQHYSRFFTIESYRWEHEAMLASAHFQDAIEPPSAFDIVVLILWSRLGTPLPERTATREYRGIDGRVPVTGTEWEYEEALAVAREKKAPDLLAFRNISPAPIDPRDPTAQAESMAQLGALNEFWKQHFADKGVFLAAYDEYRTLEEFSQRLEESLRKLIERRIKSAIAELGAALWLGEPFRGLESYEFEHALIFFGRDAAITKATEQLAANARAGQAFLLVSGPSGSGKSSLAKAGIVPRLMKPQRISGAAFVRRAVVRPTAEGTDVFLGLAHVLMRTGDDDRVGLRELIAEGQNVEQLANFLRNAAKAPGFLFGNALGRLTDAGRRSGRLLAFENAKLVLIVDQLEELVTNPAIGSEDASLFMQLLGGLARSDHVWVIATLRDDFWHRAVEISELRILAENQGRIDLAAPSLAELAEMIRRPAQAAGLSFEADPETGLGLDAVLAEDAAAAPGALPLLSFTLDELYKAAKARGETVLSHATYQSLGGLQGAIANRAETLIGSLPAATQMSLPRVLRALTTVSGAADQTPVAQSASLASFRQGTPARALVDAFVAARLMVAASEADTLPTVRLAHEALISRWQRAREIVSENADFYRIRADIEEQRERYEKGGRRSELLLRGRPLAEAEDIVTKHGDELSPQIVDYVGYSRARANRSKVIAWGAAAVFAVLALTAFGLAKFAFDQMVTAQGREMLVRSQTLLMQDKILQSVQEGLRAFTLLPSETTRSNLIAALSRISPYFLGVLDSSDDAPLALTWISGDAAAITTTSGKLQYLTITGASVATDKPHWTVQTPANIQRPLASAVALRRLSDGEIVIVYSDGAIGVLRDHASEAIAYEPNNSDDIYSLSSAVAISRNGSLISMASVANGIESFRCQWRDNATDPCISFHLPLSPSEDYRAVAISPDEHSVAVGDQAGDVFICTSASCRTTPSPVGVAIRSLAWSNDGKALAVGTMSGEVAVLDPNSLVVLAHASSRDPITALAWRPSGSEIASACDGNVICLFELANDSPGGHTLRLVARLIGHRGTVLRLSWSPQRNVLVSMDGDGKILAWGANQNTDVIYELPQCDAAEFATLAVSSDLSQIAAGGADGQTCVWSVASGKLLAAFADDRRSPVESMAWGGRHLLAILHQDGALKTWSDDPPQYISFPSLPIEFKPRVIWSADDSTLVVSASLGQVAFVDARNSSKPATLVRFFSSVNGASGLAVRRSDDVLFVSYSGRETGQIPMVDLHSGKLIAVIPTQPSFSGSLSLSPDGQLLAENGSSSDVYVHRLSPNSMLQKLPVSAPGSVAVAFSPDGRRLAALGAKGVIYVWDMSSAEPALLETLELGGSAILDNGQQGVRRVNWIAWLASNKLAGVSSNGKLIVVRLDEKSWEARIRALGLAPAN
jgi:WD40 repeat protein